MSLSTTLSYFLCLFTHAFSQYLFVKYLWCARPVTEEWGPKIFPLFWIWEEILSCFYVIQSRKGAGNFPFHTPIILSGHRKSLFLILDTYRYQKLWKWVGAESIWMSWESFEAQMPEKQWGGDKQLAVAKCLHRRATGYYIMSSVQGMAILTLCCLIIV